MALDVGKPMVNVSNINRHTNQKCKEVKQLEGQMSRPT